MDLPYSETKQRVAPSGEMRALQYYSDNNIYGGAGMMLHVLKEYIVNCICSCVCQHSPLTAEQADVCWCWQKH